MKPSCSTSLWKKLWNSATFQRTEVREARRQIGLRRRSAPEWNANPSARGQRTAVREDRRQIGLRRRSAPEWNAKPSARVFLPHSARNAANSPASLENVNE
ncbi:MAG: hypothetical protein LBD06_08700 [Candidatus Accumulibacter sp.]|nr:hypothetical protein [Accumulibacter sp.]